MEYIYSCYLISQSWEAKGRYEAFGAAFENSSVADSPYCHWLKLSGLITTAYAYKLTCPLRETPKWKAFEECVHTSISCIDDRS